MSTKKTFKVICLFLAVVVICGVVGIIISTTQKDNLIEMQKEAIEKLEREKGTYNDGNIILQSTSDVKAKELAELFGAKLRITKDGKYARLTLPEGITILDIFKDSNNAVYIDQMTADYHVSLEEAEEIYSSEKLPIAPNYNTSDTEYYKQTYLNYINMSSTWFNYTGADVTVAVIDSGIDTDHPEFDGRISTYSYNVTADKVVKDYLLDDGTPDWSLIEDEDGHGTAVTGVIASNMNNGNIVGIAPDVNILTIKAECNEYGFFSVSDLIFGVYYAIEQDVDVINMSFSVFDYEDPFEDVIRLAYDSDIICVASAGNSQTSGLVYPASNPLVIGVGALKEDSWELAKYSNYGENSDLVAPGTVYTTKMGGGYQYMEGTSFSAPIVSGAVAFYKQMNKYVTFEEVSEILYASCYDLGEPGNDWYYGFGALDISAFILEDRGTVTFDMLTDELENFDRVFIRGHALQELPEPERLYAVFDGWYYDDAFNEPLEYYSDRFYDDLTLYAKWINEDDGIPFTYNVLDDGTVEITSYKGHRRFITVPNKIEGRIVSSIADHAFEGETKLREVGLPSGLKNIGDYAFFGCCNLTSIEIPAEVVTIGNSAFGENIRLFSVEFIGESKLQLIKSNAFYSCSSLERIELPSSTITVESFVFANCTKLISAVLSKNLESIDGSAFYNTRSLYSIGVEKGNQYFTSVDGVLYTADKSKIVAYPVCHGDRYTLESETTVIGDYAFAFVRFKEFDLTNIINIGESAFIYSSLENIVIPDSVIAMGNGVFSENSSLKSAKIGKGLTKISNGTFIHCISLVSIEIPNTVTVIDTNAFLKSGLKVIDFEENSRLETINSNAFMSCPITKIVIPASVKTIGGAVFKMSNLKQITFAENSELKTIGGGAFYGCIEMKNIELPSKLASVGVEAFSMTGLEEILFPKNVSDIGKAVLSYCYLLKNIYVEDGNSVYCDVEGVLYNIDKTIIHTYPAGRNEYSYTIESTVKKINPFAFAGTTELYDVVLPYELTVIGESAFYDAGIRYINLPYGLEEIQEYAFYGCKNISDIYIPDNVTQIGRYAFGKTRGLYSVTFGTESKLPRLSYRAFAYSGIQSITIPKNVSTIAQEVFLGCYNLSYVTFAENSKLEYISAYLFDGCKNIIQITFENGSALTALQAHAFDGMDRLTTINFGDAKLETVDNFAFRFCESLSNVTFPDTLVDIGRYAFYGCKSMSEIIIPENVEHIGRFAFLDTNNPNLYFKSTSLPEYLDENWDYGIEGYYVGAVSVDTKGDYVYATLTSGKFAIVEYIGSDTVVDLTKIDLGGEIAIIGGSAFEESTVEEIVLPQTLNEIQAKAFRYSKIKSISIPSGVTFIGREAFAHTDIESLIFESNSSIRVIEQYAFEKTDKLRAVSFPKTLETLGTGVFLESGLTSITFEEGIILSEIPQRAFTNTEIIELVLPDSVTLVNHNAFNGVKELKSVTFGKNDGIRLMSNAFYQTGIESLHIPKNVTFIGEYCFVGLSELKEFTIDIDNPNYMVVDGLLLNKSGRKLLNVPAGRTGSLTVPLSVEEIGFGAFEESKLSEIKFHEECNILSFGYRAFFKANEITTISIPASVVSIDYYAFAYCENLESVIFAKDNKLKGIYEGAFCGDFNLENIVIPDSVVEISDYSFFGCESLDKLPFSENSSIKGIYDYAFAYTGLKDEFKTPKGLLDIGNYAFMANDINKVIISDENKKQLIIGVGAFEGCNKIEEIVVPFIGKSYEDDEIAWFGYIFGAGKYEVNGVYVPESLKTVTLTDGITTIGVGGFAYCSNLETINIPDSVNIIREDSFTDTTASYQLSNEITTISRIDYYGNVYYYADQGHFGYGITGEVKLSDNVTSISQRAFEKCEKITKVVIPESIKAISSYAFFDCTSLEKVDIPDSVTSLGDYAFANCSSLTDIRLSNNIENIESGAFSGCKSLEDVSLPEGLTSIEDYMFSNCTNLKNVTIPTGVTSIGMCSFADCLSLEGITLPNGLTSIGYIAFGDCRSLKGLDIPESVTILEGYAFENCISLTDIKIPEGITSIENGTFKNCTSLLNAEMSDNVVTIGYDAFYNCTSLENIDISSGIKTINESAFRQCTSLTSIIIPDGLTTIEDYTFYYCDSLETITLGSGLTQISGTAFYGCTNLSTIRNNSSLTLTIGGYDNGYVSHYSLVIIDKQGNKTYRDSYFSTEYVDTPDGWHFEKNGDDYYLVGYYGKEETVTLPETINGKEYTLFRLFGVTNVIVPEGMTTINENAFYGCTTLRSIVLPESVTSVGGYAFFGCHNLESVVLSEKVTVIEGYTFFECKNLSSIKISNSITSIGSGAFYGCGSLTSLSLPETITSIGSGAFENCKSLTNINIPKEITEINYSTFRNCISLESIVIPDGVKFIDGDAFGDCRSLTNVSIPDSVYYIADGAFSNCKALKKFVMGSGVYSFDGSVIEGCTNLEEIIISEQNLDYSSVDGVIYNKDRSKIVYVPKSITGNFSIPDSVNSIEKNAFSGCAGITGITVPSSVTYIGENAFSGCTSLTNIELPNSISSFFPGTFEGCTSLEEIIIPQSVTYIGDSVFKNCTSLSKITILGGVTTIGNYAFEGCSALTSISLPSSVQSIGGYAFLDCTSLVNITISNGTATIENCAFYGCTSLESIIIPDSVTYVGPSAFYNCTSLSDVTLSKGMSVIENSVFYNCTNLEIVNIPASVTEIKSFAFESCTSLKSLNLPENLTSIGSYAFYRCESLTDIDLSGVTSIEEYTFYRCTNLKNVIIGNKVTSIGDYAFEDCDSLQSIVITDSVKSIGYRSFYSNDKLEKITFGKGLTTIGNSAFSYCNRLVNLDFPNGLEKIEDMAFYNCHNIQTVTIHESLTYIGNMAFAGCNNLFKVYNNSSLELTFGGNSNGNIAYSAWVIVDKQGNEVYKDSMSEVDGWVYKVQNGRYYLVGYLGEEDTVTLPETLNGNDYSYTFLFGVKNLIIPECITSIPNNAFADCTTLRTVKFHDRLTSIGNRAFSDCVNLTSVCFPDSVKEIGAFAFSGCSGLMEVVLPDGLTKIDSCVFYGCSSLKNIVFPESLNYIANQAFTSCTSLTNIKIPENVDFIGKDAFDDTGFYNDPSNWKNGCLIVDGWLIKADKNLRYLSTDGIYEVAEDAYEDCSLLKNPVYVHNLYGISNAETIIVTKISNQLYWNLSTVKNVIITDSISASDLKYNPYFFGNLSNTTIFVESSENDLRWDENFPGWNNGNNVVYGDDWKWTHFYDENGALIKSEPRLNHQVIIRPVMNDYVKNGNTYAFSGWDLDGDGFVDTVPATSVVEIKAYAVYRIVHECDYTQTVIPPTCTEDGYTSHQCTICDDCYITDIVPALGHSFDEKLICFTCGEHITGFVKVSEGTRYYYPDGSFAKGWCEIDGKTYRFDPQTGLLFTEPVLHGTLDYYFNSDHSTMEGLVHEDGGVRFYKKGVRLTGWADTNSDGVKESYFFSSTGLRCEENRVLFDGKDTRRFYIFNPENGSMETVNGFYKDENGTRFFVNGIQKYGWITPDGEIINDRSGVVISGAYYFTYGDGKNHYMVESESLKIGGIVRTFDENHLVKAYTGWYKNKKTGGNNYYINGVMQQGWCETTEGWVYLSRSENLKLNITYGDAIEGWKKIGGKVYYFRSSSSTPAYIIISDPTRKLTYNGVRSEYTINQTPANGNKLTGSDFYITNPPVGF